MSVVLNLLVASIVLSNAHPNLFYCLCRPLFNAVMSRRSSSFTHISSLSGLDERDPDRASFNFRHVALVYQVYMEDLTIVDEDESDRLLRIKLVTKLLAKIVEESLSLYKVCHAQPPCI